MSSDYGGKAGEDPARVGGDCGQGGEARRQQVQSVGEQPQLAPDPRLYRSAQDSSSSVNPSFLPLIHIYAKLHCM